MSDSILEAIHRFNNEFEVKTANTPDIVEETYRLRYQVYCIERHFLDGNAGIESDEFDSCSRHTVLINKTSGAIVGSARLILGSSRRPHDSFPMQHLCSGRLPPGVNLDTAAEVSRFAISKERRSQTANALMRLALVQGLLDLSAQLGLVHWCAVMEPCLLRLLEMSAIRFKAFGPLVEYHGLRQPCFNRIDDLLEGVATKRMELWNFLTGNGGLWSARHAPALAVAA